MGDINIVVDKENINLNPVISNSIENVVFSNEKAGLKAGDGGGNGEAVSANVLPQVLNKESNSVAVVGPLSVRKDSLAPSVLKNLVVSDVIVGGGIYGGTSNVGFVAEDNLDCME
ncbi:hypothetical protein ACOSP7_014987 [Xanthoceras sorbifolium]